MILCRINWSDKRASNAGWTSLYTRSVLHARGINEINCYMSTVVFKTRLFEQLKTQLRSEEDVPFHHTLQSRARSGGGFSDASFYCK